MDRNISLNKILIGICVVTIIVVGGLKGYGYYLDTEIARIQAEIAALTTEVTVECGFSSGKALVTVLVPTEIINAMDAWEVDEFNDVVCDNAREVIEEALGNE